ncbi:MAG TPA: MOSC N-terminal beta barrel domain-containing protein [Mycobacteriales bacterium]|nr:MOSC N-terminal beta barrel domain-containing protein [Mycobacteriales bacterium]
MSSSGTVAVLRRYPVKSMLGEDVAALPIGPEGVSGDRVAAVIDDETGVIASAKHPKLWRELLRFQGRWNDGAPMVQPPDGAALALDDPRLPAVLSAALARPVHLATDRPEGARVGRPAPEDVIERGSDADVPYEHLTIGTGTPGRNFVDYAPVHLITTATLRRVGADLIRYRPNVVLDLPGLEPYAENGWSDREIMAGAAVLSVLGPTPRCAVPTLEHGRLPREVGAVRVLMRENRIAPSDSGTPQPCLGAYARVVRGGRISLGDPVRLG